MSSTATSHLLSFRVSAKELKEHAAETRKPRHYEKTTTSANASNTQAILVSGFNEDAASAIKASNGGKDVMNVSYVLGKDMRTIAWQVEDILLVPSKHWRLTPKEQTMLPEDTLSFDYGNKPTKAPIELLLVPEDALVYYIAEVIEKSESTEFHPVWRYLPPSPPPADISEQGSGEYLARASAAFNLLSPSLGAGWDGYFAQRQDSEWKLARMRYRLSKEDHVESYLGRIKDAVEAILAATKLTENERRVVADGVLPQGLEVEDDGDDGDFLSDVTVFARIYSPCRPTLLDVFLERPDKGAITILYRVHDPAPPAGQWLKIFHIRSVEGPPKVGKSGWRRLFAIKRETPTRGGKARKTTNSKWDLSRAEAAQLHDVLFGGEGHDVAKKVPIEDAVRLVMASVGFHFELGTGSGDPKDKDRIGKGEGWVWEIDCEEWIGTQLRATCDAPSQGDKAGPIKRGGRSGKK
ncbi:hypothetical protein C8Q79DRAFT_1007816 [Trametes meyenii]|nr:hypothetical protein C8Q79DRAFT_1007816 [Trametes meyenii]